MPQDKIAQALKEHATLIEETFRQQGGQLEDYARKVVATFHRGGKLFLIGNGPMGAVANLVASLFLHRLTLERPLLPVISLCHDVTLATSLGRAGENQQFFARQLRALAGDGDMALIFGDAGRDKTLEEALTVARQMGCATAALLRARNAEMGESPDFLFPVETDSLSRAIEASLFFGHLLVELVESELFGI